MSSAIFAEVGSVSLIDEQDRVLVERVADATAELWVELHRMARHTKVPKEVRDRVLEILGGGVFEWCWDLKEIDGCAISRGGKSTEPLTEFICESQSLLDVCAKVCRTLSMMAARIKAIEQDSERPKNQGEVKQQLLDSICALRSTMRKLASSAVLTAMPDTERPMVLRASVMTAFAVAVANSYDKLCLAARSSHQGSRVSAKVGEAVGVALFAGIRAQQNGLAEEGLEGLTAWLTLYAVRNSERFFVQVAGGISELERISRELAACAVAEREDSRTQATFFNAVSAVDESVVEILASGILFSLPV